jgi:DNA polymerase III delta' subunit
MRLDEVIGQPATVRLLRRLIQRQRLPHAILLEGQPGCGRRTLALALAQTILCQQPAAGDACGRCESCRLAIAGNHPDLVSSLHDSQPGSMDADTVRDELVEAVYTSPLIGERRVFVLHGIERWQSTSANALLKALEEPPSSVRFIATTAHSAAVLKTIRSRLQLYRLQTLGADDLERILIRTGIPVEVARSRAAVSGAGSHRGLLRDEVPAPLVALRRLALEGYRTEWVAEALQALPTTLDDTAAASGVTVAAEQRRLLRGWLSLLAQELRGDMRANADAPLAVQIAERMQRLDRLRGDLARNFQPRLVIEALGLAESDVRLRRSGG